MAVDEALHQILLREEAPYALLGGPFTIVAVEEARAHLLADGLLHALLEAPGGLVAIQLPITLFSNGGEGGIRTHVSADRDQ